MSGHPSGASPRPAPSTAGVSPAAIWTALVTVYLVWGSTYLAIRVVVETMPPLVAMGARFLVAGALLGAVLAVRRGPRALRVSPRQIGGAAVVGFLLLLGGNGGVAVAEQTVPSGLTALLVAATPLWLVCLRTAARDRPAHLSLLGTLLGFAGIAVLVRPGASLGEDVEAWGVLLVVAAAACWATGSFLASRLPMPADAFVGTTWQMLIGGIALVVVGAARGELDGFRLGQVAGEAWAWLAYLVVVGSIVAFSAYVWLLHNAPISLTATYAYVNPVVAVVLGVLVLSEPVTGAVLLGGAVVVLGVGLVVSGERPRRRPTRRDPVGQDEVVDLPA
ncbi:MAG: EamA family transporter [Actinomycetes bacterium]